MVNKQSLWGRHQRQQRRVAALIDVRQSGPVDLDAVLDTLGARVVQTEREEDVLLTQDDDHILVQVPAGYDQPERRMAVASIIGIMEQQRRVGRISPLLTLRRSTVLEGARLDGRAFALALLMPSRAFRAAYRDSGGDVAVLAERFDVPADAVLDLCNVMNLPAS